MSLYITKIDGTREDINANKIKHSIEVACRGLLYCSSRATQIAAEAQLTLYNGITTAELNQAVINAAVQNIKDDPDFDIIAARLLLKTIYKEVLGDFVDTDSLERRHREDFPTYVQRGWSEGLLSSDLRVFDLKKLASALDLGRDSLLTYTGLATMKNRYLNKGSDQKLRETPQYFWMRVAMGLAFKENNPTVMAQKFYHKMSSLEYIAGGSTNINAGALSPRLSNCFILDLEDNIDHIGKTVADIMKLSKATGGIGLSVTKLRANGSPISTNNTFSSGPIPFLHIIDSTIRAISRAGKKMGALCFYMENWHLDFQDFLDLKQNAGDDYRRTRTADTAVWISDEFMERVKNNDAWYLFDPQETPDLVDLYGPAFSSRYREYIQQAEAGQMRIFKKIPATEQFNNIIVALQGASHPWLTWKDAVNVRALNNNTGTIHSSNLCTEITLPADKNNVAVCNLLSINLARHLNAQSNIDWSRLRDSVKLGLRQLDNLVDINQPPITEAINFDHHNRAVGLGVMGLADLLEKMDLAYDSPAAYELSDELMEFISYHAIETSADLAAEKGSYDNFNGSGWSKGYVPYDTLNFLEESRDRKLNLTKKINKQINRADWELLRSKVRRGMRNSTLMAIAPTANIGLIAGTSTGIDPRFAQIFSRNTLSGKYLELNFNLVKKLKELNLWELTSEKILIAQGDLTNIEEIPNELKTIYKDSFSVAPEALIEIAARAQKWVDQAISRNMYLTTRDTEKISQLYILAWEKGLKTTYYLHMKPRHTAEQSTVKVNKSTATGKKGFGAILAEKNAACPIDPQERLLCDSCQ
ncbi:MAG: ribonucleoside-diphosphate reductase subunit alpha [Patescibacteria group bacterium]|jgi:ribonucleoside-diphosphate reductase alpha chain